MATPKKRAPRRRSHPVTKQEMVANNPATAEAVMQRFSPLQKSLVYIAGAVAGLAAIGTVWSWFGAKTVVWDRDLAKVVSDQNTSFENKLGTVKAEVNTKIDNTKDEVVKNQNTIKGEITGTLSELTKTLNNVAKSQVMSTMDQLDMQVRLGFTQKQSLQGQLAVVNQILDKNKNDPLAQARKMQLEDFIKQNEAYMQDAQQKMSRLRNNN